MELKAVASHGGHVLQCSDEVWEKTLAAMAEKGVTEPPQSIAAGPEPQSTRRESAIDIAALKVEAIVERASAANEMNAAQAESRRLSKEAMSVTDSFREAEIMSEMAEQRLLSEFAQSRISRINERLEILESCADVEEQILAAKAERETARLAITAADERLEALRGSLDHPGPQTHADQTRIHDSIEAMEQQKRDARETVGRLNSRLESLSLDRQELRRKLALSIA